jgi:hypothetical protein
MEWSYGRDEVMLFFSPAGLVIVAPLPNGNFRIVATLKSAPEHPNVADMQTTIDARVPLQLQTARPPVQRLLHHEVDRWFGPCPRTHL